MNRVLLWTAATLGVYAGSAWLSRRFGGALWALPVLTGTAGMLMLLASSGTTYADYAQATAGLRWLIGPAVMALAVPLARQRPLWLAMARPLALATLAGGAGAVLATALLGRWLGLPWTWVASLMPRSTTMPVAMLSAGAAGGVPAWAALAVVATGVLGTAFTPLLLHRVLRCEDSRVHAFTLGLSAHLIGTASNCRPPCWRVVARHLPGSSWVKTCCNSRCKAICCCCPWHAQTASRVWHLGNGRWP
jgi:putative effector of murein hydrolase